MSSELFSRLNIGTVTGTNGAQNAVGVFHGNVTIGTNQDSNGIITKPFDLLKLT
jgi:hypothetical protein